MKHTYLYPLMPGEKWLWRAARMNAADLFGPDDMEESDPAYLLPLRVGDEIAGARTELHRRLKSRDRICAGEHYLIPGSLCEVAQERGRDADWIVRNVTMEIWEPLPFGGIRYANVRMELVKGAGQKGRSEAEEIRAFCSANRATPENPKPMVIPVWM